MKLSANNPFGNLILTIAVLSLADSLAIAQPVAANLKSISKAERIEGKSGGSVDSQGCGFIANSPNYTMNLPQRIDYMRLTVETAGGQPTLLVLGPSPGDSFCVLGDEVSGLKPEISGVWEAGNYQIYVGDRIGKNYQFTLNISRTIFFNLRFGYFYSIDINRPRRCQTSKAISHYLQRFTTTRTSKFRIFKTRKFITTDGTSILN
jgi:hypothetical protein